MRGITSVDGHRKAQTGKCNRHFIIGGRSGRSERVEDNIDPVVNWTLNRSGCIVARR